MRWRSLVIGLVAYGAPATATEPERPLKCQAVDAWRAYQTAQWAVDAFVENPRADRLKNDPDETITDRAAWQDAMTALHKNGSTLRRNFHNALDKWAGDEGWPIVSDRRLRDARKECRDDR